MNNLNKKQLILLKKKINYLKLKDEVLSLQFIEEKKHKKDVKILVLSKNYYGKNLKVA